MLSKKAPQARPNSADLADWWLIPEDLRRNVAPSGRCLVWTGDVRRGRGWVTVSGAPRRVEAVVWSFANDRSRKVGVVQVCGNSLCVRPSHLAEGWPPRASTPEPKTCRNGHPWTDENTHIRKNGKRDCRACARERARRDRRRDGPLRPTAGQVNASKTTCPAGHPLAGENLYVDPRGFRRCRACAREQNRNRRAVAEESPERAA